MLQSVQDGFKWNIWSHGSSVTYCKLTQGVWLLGLECDSDLLELHSVDQPQPYTVKIVTYVQRLKNIRIEKCVKGGKHQYSQKACSVTDLSCQACGWPKVLKRILDHLGLMLHFCYTYSIKHPFDTMGRLPTRGYGWGNWRRFTRAPLIVIGVIVPCFAWWSKTLWQGSWGPIFIHLCDLSVRRFRKDFCHLIVDQFIDCTVWYMTDQQIFILLYHSWIILLVFIIFFFSWFIFFPLKSMYLSCS